MNDNDNFLYSSDSDLCSGIILLPKEGYEHVLELIKNPPPPTEALKKLMQEPREEARLKRELPTDSGR